MTKFAAVILAALALAPVTASAEYLCEKMWNTKYGGSCPAGSSWDARSATCIIKR